MQLTTDDKLFLLSNGSLGTILPSTCTKNVEMARIALHSAVDKAFNDPCHDPRPTIHSAVDNVLNYLLLQAVLAPEMAQDHVQKAWQLHQQWPSDPVPPHNLETLTGNPGIEEAMSHLVIVDHPVKEPVPTVMLPKAKYIKRRTRQCSPKGRSADSAPLQRSSVSSTPQSKIDSLRKEYWQRQRPTETPWWEAPLRPSYDLAPSQASHNHRTPARNRKAINWDYEC